MSAPRILRLAGILALATLPFAAARGAAQAAPAGGAPPGGPLYQKYCSQCHGEKGDGNGPAAIHLRPRPRDFTAGKFKIRHTASGALPTDDDLRHVIREGMPYTSMPPWRHLSDADIETLVGAVKSFAPDFADPAKKPKPITIPEGPKFSPESAAKGKAIYAKSGCDSCHGDAGRGNGAAAASLTDDWGNPIWPADLTMRWTFRGGPTRQDIYRTFTTGLNGTPMPAFAESLTDAERWQLVDYIESLDPRDAPGYSNLLQVRWTADDLDLAKGKELFNGAPASLFPLIGQVTQPGREFHPPTSAVTVRGVYNSREIALMVSWHDRVEDAKGHNAPDIPVTKADEDGAAELAGTPANAGTAATAGGESGDIWGGEEAPAATPTPAASPAGAADSGAAAGEGGGDIWGAESADSGAASDANALSDAVAIQLPVQLPVGNRKPYFIFGDEQNAVDLWFVDLATKVAQRYSGAGSDKLTRLEGEDVSAVAKYDNGEWTVIMKRVLRASDSVSFVEDEYVPIAFSVWDGASNERGNRRGLTQWMYLYTMPQETKSAILPMVESALAVLLAEIALIAWLRRRARRARPGAPHDEEVAQHV